MIGIKDAVHIPCTQNRNNGTDFLLEISLAIPFRKKFLYYIGTTGIIAGIKTIWNQRNVISVASYVDPAIGNGWEFDKFEEEN